MLLEEQIFLHKKLTPFEKRGKNENSKVASPESIIYPFNLVWTNHRYPKIPFLMAEFALYVCHKSIETESNIVAQWVKRWPADLVVLNSSPD